MIVARAEALLDASGYEPEKLPAAMGAAARLLGFDYFGLANSNIAQPAFIVPEEQAEGIGRYFNDGWLSVDYRARNERTLPLNTIFLDHRAVPEEERRRSAIYNELFVPWRMAYYAGIRFPLDAGEEWFCFVARAEDRGGIEGADVTNFRRIARAAMSAATMAVHTDAAHARGVLKGLIEGRVAAALLDHNGRVSVLTPAAEALFDPSFGVRDGLLWASSLEDRQKLDGLTWRAHARNAPLPVRAFTLRANGPGRPIQVDVSRVEGAGLDELPGARLLLVFRDPSAGDASLAQRLCVTYGLTPAEGDVVVLFGEGLSILQIAGRRNVTQLTIRQQMKSVYRKMGIHRQVDLLGILVGLRR